jgi:hypothetical protein
VVQEITHLTGWQNLFQEREQFARADLVPVVAGPALQVVPVAAELVSIRTIRDASQPTAFRASHENSGQLLNEN